MGALPGGGFLTDGWFDVDAYRSAGERRAVVWRPDRTVLVLGSTQRVRPTDPGGTPVVRRRSGGGAVLVVPGETVWVDVWVPRGDPLWDDDVVRATGWAGRWWAAGIAAAVGADLEVHLGPSEPRPWSDLVCFAGVGPGEVLARGRKLVGLAQWRSREGALFQGCCYRRWDPAPLLRLLGVDDPGGEVRRAAAGLDELAGGVPPEGDEVVTALLQALPPGPRWEVGP